MHSSVRSFLPVTGVPVRLAAAFRADPDRWLPGARRDGPRRYATLLHAGALTRAATVTVGDPWRAGKTLWRSLTWEPTTVDGDAGTVDRLLPTLDGELGLHREDGGRVTLVLDARYRPPGGALGAAADAAGLRRIARGTIQRFLEDTSARLASEALLLDGPLANGQLEQHHGAASLGPRS